MGWFKAVQCIRCKSPLGTAPYYLGCPKCESEGVTCNYTTVYDLSEAYLPEAHPGAGIWSYKPFYPVYDNAREISLQEGNTPLIHLKSLGERLGLNRLYVKDESRNPTLSFKDRFCSVAITKAVQDSAPGIVVSSTGNQGASAAAYAAKAGKPCIIFTVAEVPDTMKTLMLVYGAAVVMVPTSLDRWKLMRLCVQEFGWAPISGFVSPPIGSNCYGVDGYKSMAFEVYRQLQNTAPDAVIFPTAYSDGLYGFYKGMEDLRELKLVSHLPKLIASEVFGSMEQTLAVHADRPVAVGSSWSVSFSIAGSLCTWQGLESVASTNGYARCSNDAETLRMQILLARTEGLYAENSSVTSLVCAGKLAAEGKIGPDDTVVAVLTSTGLKDPVTTQKNMPTVPHINPDRDELRKALANSYGIKL